MQHLTMLKSGGVVQHNSEDNSEIEKLVAENGKLNYRINIMKRVINLIRIYGERYYQYDLFLQALEDSGSP